MILRHISILNYRNLQDVDLNFSNKMNCFFGRNGMGKTNLLDSIYYLSFSKSSSNPYDAQNIRHGEDYFMIKGDYENSIGERVELCCGMKPSKKKFFKKDKKEYSKLSAHIGFIPLVLVSPSDAVLILGGSEERRKFMDIVISQYDKSYLEALMKYKKALTQRNSLLKEKSYVDKELFSIIEEVMSETGAEIYKSRKEFVEKFIPMFQEFYTYISGGNETVELIYNSNLHEGNLIDMFDGCREKDRILGYSTIGIHKDDLEMNLSGFPIKKEGSQGQNKTYLIALKMAQFVFLDNESSYKPILLLDDIFDKLDAERMEKIMQLVASDRFGQIFISDTNRENLDRILETVGKDYKIFITENGEVRNG